MVLGSSGSLGAKASAISANAVRTGASGVTSVNNLVTNADFAYDNNNGAPVDLDPVEFPVISSLATTTVNAKNLANLGTIKSVMLDSLTIDDAAVSPTFISEISLVAPDGTHIPYKINPYLTTWMPSFATLSYSYAEQAFQDLDYSLTAPHYVPINNNAMRFTLDLLRPSLISRIEIATDGNQYGNVMLTDTFNNYWTTSALDKPVQSAPLYNSPLNPSVPAVSAKTQTNRNNQPVSYGASAEQYALSNQTFAGRKVFPGTQTTFYQYFNYGYDPLFSIPYPSTGREGVSVFYQGPTSLENALKAADPIPGAYDGSRFSIGTVRLNAAQSSVWAYTVSPLVDFDQLKSLNKGYLQFLFDNKRIIARSPTALTITTDDFESEAGKVLSLRLPVKNPTTGVGGGGSIASASLLIEDIFKPLFPEGSTKPSPTYLSENFDLRFRTEWGYRTGPNPSYFLKFKEADEDAEFVNIIDRWLYNQHSQIELELNAKRGSKLSLGSFGRSYSVNSYSLENPAQLVVEPTVTPSDFIFNSLITNYGMEELGNISLITITMKDPYTGTEEAANNLQRFLSELTVYADRESTKKIPYEIVSFVDENAGSVKAAGDQLLSVMQDFLTDDEEGYANTLKRIIDAKTLPADTLTLFNSQAGTSLRFKQTNDGTAASNFTALILDDGQKQEQKITLRLYNPQPVNHIGIYFNSPGLAVPAITVTTSDSLNYTPIAPVYQNPQGREFFDDYLQALQDDDVLAAADRTGTVVFEARPADSKTFKVTTAAPTAGGQVYKTLPRDKGEIMFGAAEAQTWAKPTQFFDESRVSVIDLQSFGPISGGKISLAGLAGSSLTNTLAFRYLRFFDKDGKQIMWKVAGDRSTPEGRVFKGRFTRGYDYDLKQNYNTGLVRPYGGDGDGRPYMANNYAVGYFTNNIEPFETAAQTGNAYFYAATFSRYSYSGQGTLGALSPAEWAFYFPDGPQTVSYVTYAGYSPSTAPTSLRFKLTLFSEVGKQYELASYDDRTPGFVEYWEGMGDAMQVVIGKSKTTWVASTLSAATTNVQFSDDLSFQLSYYDWKYRNWYLRRMNDRNFKFEAFSTTLNQWVLLDAYRFAPDPLKPHNNLYVSIRWSRADGARFINGVQYKSMTVDFSFLRFQSSQVPVRSINVDTSALTYTLNNGFGSIAGLTFTLPSNMQLAYAVKKAGGRNYTSASRPTDLQNGDQVSLVFSLTDGSVFYDPQNQDAVYGSTFRIDLPLVDGLPEPTNDDLSDELSGWVQSDAKIRMAYEGSDYGGTIASSAIANLVSLQQSIPNSEVFVRYISNRQQFDVPVTNQTAIRALKLANDMSFSVYIRMINGDTVSYLSSGMVQELLLNTYTVSALPLPRFAPVPTSEAFNQSLYVADPALSVYKLNPAATINENWEVSVTVTNRSTFQVTTYDGLPGRDGRPDLPGNVTVQIQVTPKAGFVFGTSATYKGTMQVASFTLNYDEVSTGSQDQIKYVNYDANHLPEPDSAFPGIYGLNDYLGAIDAPNSSFVNNLAAVGLNVEMKINGAVAFTLENGQLTVNRTQIANGDSVEISVYPRLGYAWFSSTGLVPAYTRLTKTYAISGLLTANTAVVPVFNNELSGFNGGNTFAEVTTKTSASVAAKAIKNFNTDWAAAGISARIAYLPTGNLPSSIGLLAINQPYDAANPDRPGLLAADGSQFNVKNGSVLAFILASVEQTGDNVVRFANGSTNWVKIIAVAGLPNMLELPPLPAMDDKSVLDNNVFLGTVSDNSFGASFDPSWLTANGVRAKLELYNDATATTPVRQLGSTVPAQGPFVKGQVVSLTLSRDARNLWWGQDVLVSPLTQNWRYTVPELPQNGSKVETSTYADLQTKSTVTFDGLNNSATAVLNLGGTVPPIDASLTRQTGASAVSVIFTVYTGPVNNSVSSYYKQVPITADDIKNKKVVLAVGPNDLAKITNGQLYTVRLVPNYGYELTLNGATRASDNPWLINQPQAAVTGLLENVFVASGMSRPVPVNFAGVSGINATITNLFDQSFFSSAFGRFDVYFATTSAPKVLYTPAKPNHAFTNGEKITVVLVPDHNKYIIDPAKTSTVNGKLVGNADDVYEQPVTVSGIDEPINVKDVAAQFSAIKDWFALTEIEGGFYVKLSDEVVTAINGTAQSRRHAIKDAVDYVFSFKDADGRTISLGADKFLQGVWLMDSVSDQNTVANFYSYSSGGVTAFAVGKQGYALVDNIGANGAYLPAANNTAVLMDLNIPEVENKAVSVSAFDDALVADAVFNTIDDYRAYESVGDSVKPILANALAKGRFTLELITDSGAVALAANGKPGVNNSYAVVYAKKSADGNSIDLVTTPELDQDGNLLVDANGDYATPIARIELYFKGPLSSEIALKITMDPALGIKLYQTDNSAQFSKPTPVDFFQTSKLNTSVRTIITLPSAWSTIVADANANKQYYDPSTSYEGGIAWQVADLAKYVTIDQLFSYALTVSDSRGTVLWTSDDIFKGAQPGTAPATMLLNALKTIPAQYLLVGNVVTLWTRPTSPNNTFDLASRPATAPEGYVFNASQWTIARIRLLAPQVKRAYYVPSNFAFTSAAVSGLAGSPVLSGFSGFNFAPVGTAITVSLFASSTGTVPLKTITVTDPAQIVSEIEKFKDIIRRDMVLTVVMDPAATDVFVETQPNGTVRTYGKGTPFTRSITITNVNTPITFINFSEDNLRYAYDTTTGDIKVSIADAEWRKILGETFAQSLQNVMFTVDHFRNNVLGALHTTAKRLTYAEFVDYLSNVPGKSGQTPAANQLRIADQLAVRIIAKDGFMFTNLTTEQSFRFTMRNEYVIKQSIAIKKVAAAYTTISTADANSTSVSINGVSTIVLPETIAELNAKGVNVSIEVATSTSATYTNALPPNVVNGARVTVTLSPANPLASTLLLEGETSPRALYTETYRVTGLLIPYTLQVPSQIRVLGTLNSQGSLDLSWVTPNNAFKVTTWVDEQPTAARVPDLRNGQQVSLAIEALVGNIIKNGSNYQRVLDVPTFTVSGLKSFIEPPEFPDTMLLVYNPATNAVFSDRFVNTAFVTFSYKLSLVNGQTPVFSSLTPENLKGAIAIQLIATIVPATGADDDYVFNASLAKTLSSQIYDLRPDAQGINKIIDLPGAFSEANLLRNGAQYALPEYPVPSNVRLRYTVGSQPSSVLKPSVIDATSVVTIAVELDQNTAAIAVAPAFTIPAISSSNIIPITSTTDFALLKVYGSEGNALVQFNDAVNNFAGLRGVVSELVVKRGDTVVFVGDSSSSFAAQLALAQEVLKNGDVIEINFLPAEGMIFNSPSGNQQHVLSQFTVADLAPANTQTFNTVAIAISLAAVGAILVIGVPAYFFARRMSRQ